MQRRSFADAVSHLETAVEQDAVFDRKHGRLHASVEDGGSPQFHPVLGGNVTRDLALAHDGSRGHLCLNHSLISNQEDPIGMDFAVEIPINPHGAAVGDHAFKLHSLSDEGDNVLGAVGGRRCRRRSFFRYAFTGPFCVLLLPPHEQPSQLSCDDYVCSHESLVVRTNTATGCTFWQQIYRLFHERRTRYLEENY